MTIAENQGRNVLRLLEQLRPHWRSDTALPRRIQALLSAERRFGSRDRRLYRELIYTTLRYLPWIEPTLSENPPEALRRLAWLVAETPATKPFCAAFAKGDPPAGHRPDLLPGWFREHCPAIFDGDELAAQLRRASLWLRLQTDAAGAEATLAEFSARGWQWRRSAELASAVQLLGEADVTQTDAWRDGRVEVQDLGSQLVLESIGVEPGGRWLDACAGAGGKSLQLARLLGGAGRVEAHDIRREALEELRARAERARLFVAAGVARSVSGATAPDARPGGAAAIRLRTAVAAGEMFDGVLVDAPCSGSGTWRRFPHLKWTTPPELVERRAALQRKLLTEFAAHVRPGGRLVYATCSLSRRENENVVAGFLESHSDFAATPFARMFGFTLAAEGLTIFPARHDTDGFFVASLRRAETREGKL